MSLDLDRIHQAVATAVRAAVGDEFTVHAYPGEGGTGPYIEIAPGAPYVAYFATMGTNGRADVNVTVRGFPMTGNAETAFRRVVAYLASGTDFPRSIVDALMADKSLGGVVESCVALTAEWVADEELFEIPVEIIALKSGGAA